MEYDVWNESVSDIFEVCICGSTIILLREKKNNAARLPLFILYVRVLFNVHSLNCASGVMQYTSE